MVSLLGSGSDYGCYKDKLRHFDDAVFKWFWNTFDKEYIKMNERGQLVAGVGLPGVGKSTVLRALALKKRWKYLCEPEEAQWPLAVHHQSVSGAFTSLTWFRSMRVPNLYVADALRRSGEIVLIDSYYDKVMAFYLDKPNMDWLISPADPYYGLLRQMAHIDNDVLPHANIIIFFRASFDNWEKLIMTRKRKSDIETIFPNAFYFQDILMEAVSEECVKSGSQLVIFESEFSSVEESASKLDNLLSNHI